MRRLFCFAFAVVTLVFSGGGWGYEVTTHQRMSLEAANASVLYNKSTGVMANLGLALSIDDRKQPFPDSTGRLRTIINLFAMGARFEDDFPRFLNHFYDPIYNRPLTVLGIAAGERSPDWALEDNTDFGKQEFSLRHAREYLYKALTLPTKPERDKHFGLTFQTLGQVIHHVQDMAQPQHVRNDAYEKLGQIYFPLTPPTKR